MSVCQCGKSISSPKLTGGLCTSCYFSAKKKESLLFPNGNVIENVKSNNPYVGEDNVLTKNPSEALEERVLNNPVDTEIKENNDESIRDFNRGKQEGNRSNEINTEDTGSTNIGNGTGESETTSDVIRTDEDRITTKFSVDNKQPEKGKIYCQSCIERGYGLKEASREWKTRYFVCEDCYKPLLNNSIGYEVERVEVERVRVQAESSNMPLLKAFYDLLNIPEQLRFERTDDILNKRSDIFHYHAPALVNMELKDVTSKLEELQCILFQVKLNIEPYAVFIGNAKKEAREAKDINLPGPAKKILKATSSNGDSTKSKTVAKIKLSEDEKFAKVMFPGIDIKEALVKYQETMKMIRGGK